MPPGNADTGATMAAPPEMDSPPAGPLGPPTPPGAPAPGAPARAPPPAGGGVEPLPAALIFNPFGLPGESVLPVPRTPMSINSSSDRDAVSPPLGKKAMGAA